MTYGQLFREVWLELHPNTKGELEFKIADSMAPLMVSKQVPADQVEAMQRKMVDRVKGEV